MKKFARYLLVLPAFLLLIGCPLGSSSSDQDPGNYTTVLWEQDSNGDIQFSTNNPDYKGYAFWAWLKESNQTSFSKIEVEVTRKSGSIFGAQGAVFCLQDERNFYAVLISANCDFAILKCSNGSLGYLSDWKKDFNLHAGLNVKNTIRVEKSVLFNDYNVFFNNNVTTTFNDSQLNSGYCGFIVGLSTDEQFPSTPADIRFKLLYPPLFPISNPQPADKSEIHFLSPVSLSWEAKPECQVFRVQMGTDSTFQSMNIIDVEVAARNCPVSTALELGRTYYWRVRPRDGSGEWRDWGPTWSFDITRRICTLAVQNWTGSPAVAADGSMYFDYRGKLTALNSDGTPKWTFAQNSLSSSPVVAPDGSIYYVSGPSTYDKWLYKILPNGALDWSKDLVTDSVFQPVVDNVGRVYVIDYVMVPGYNVIDYSKLSAFDSSGNLVWEFKVPPDILEYQYVALSNDGHIYFMTGDSLYCLDNLGKKQWEYVFSMNLPSQFAVDSRNNVIFIDHSPSSLCSISSAGVLNWRLYLSSTTGNRSPVIGKDDTIYVVGSRTGYRASISAISSSGTKLWEYIPKEVEVFSTPAIGADGTIFVSTNWRDRVFAINPDGSLKWIYRSAKVQSECPMQSPLLLADGTLIYASSDDTAAITTECGGLADTAWPRSYQNNQNTGMKSGVGAGAALKNKSALKATFSRGVNAINAVKARPKYQQQGQKADICPR